MSDTITFVSSVLIGRESELNTLTNALDAARLGQGQCILLAGEAGIGKSRLLDEIRTRAVQENFVVLQGYCFEQDVSFPYSLWINALRDFFAWRDAAEIEPLLGPLAAELVKLLPELALILPAIVPAPPLDPESEKRRLFEALTRFLAQLAASHPFLMLLEDLHWSDEASLELLRAFTHRIAERPILLLGTYRKDEQPPHLVHFLAQLKRERAADELVLTSLTRVQVAELTRTILKLDSSPDDAFLDLMMRRTDGNPFFIEEVLKTASTENQQSIYELQVPSSIYDAVQQRVNKLAPETRQILMFAAIIGQRFDFELLRQVAAQNEQELLRAIKELLAAQLLMEESAEQFVFRHALTREVVYASLLLRERQTLHRQIGETMERVWATTIDQHIAELAFHFNQAAVWDKALAYSQRAGEQAQNLFAPREALAHFTRALEAAARLNTIPSLSILSGRAHALDLLGEFDRARADYETALEAARREADRRVEWATLIDLGLLWQSRDLARAGEYFKSAIELAQSLGQTLLVGQSLNRLGNWYMNRGHPREALPYHREAFELFQVANERSGMAQTLDLLGVVNCFVGDVIQGMTYSEQAVALFRELDDRRGLINALTPLCLRPRYDVEVLGDIDLHQLIELGETALELARSFDWRQGQVIALNNIGLCLCRTGQFGRGLALFRRVVEIATEIQHRFFLAAAHRGIGAEVHLALFDSDQAREHLELALTVAQELRSELFTMVVASRLASAYIVQKDWARAQALLEPVLTTDVPDAEIDTLLRDFWTARAELELALGNSERALEIVERLLATTINLAEYGRHAVPRLSLVRGRALAALGRMQEAAIEFAGTQVVTQKRGERAILWQLHMELGSAFRALGRREDAEQEFSSARTLIQQLADTLDDGALRDNFLNRALAKIPALPVSTPRQTARKEFGGLTERERQVAALIAQGKSNREISKTLVITVRTVEAHITRILDKLDLKSRAEIAVWAVGKGLTHPST